MTRTRTRRTGRVAITLAAGASVVLGCGGFTWTTMVSVPDSGRGAALPNAHSNFPSVSGDGRVIGFMSSANNLVASDTNGVVDAFARDVRTGSTTLLSVSTSGQLADRPSQGLVTSSDGTKFAITSPATNLVAGDTNGVSDVYLRDTTAGTTTLVSTTPEGVSGDGFSLADAISSDGRYVAFTSGSDNLVPGDTDGVGDVFVRDTVAGTTTMASVSSTGGLLDAPTTEAGMSNDGRYVAFVTSADNVTPAGGNGHNQVYLRDMQTGTVTLVSAGANGQPSDGDATAPSVSADGQTVLFGSAADDLVTGDTNGVTDVFLRSLTTATTERIDVGPAGAQADGPATLSFPPHRSLDDAGCHAVFQSDADNLVPSDLNAATDVFVWDCSTGAVRRVSMHADDLHQTAFPSAHASISADGNYVAYASRDAVAAFDTDQVPDVYERFVGAQPVVSAASPSPLTPNSVVQVAITGSDFTPRFALVLPAGINVMSQQFVDAGHLQVKLQVSATAAPGTPLYGVLDLGTANGPGAIAGSLGMARLTVASATSTVRPALRR